MSLLVLAGTITITCLLWTDAKGEQGWQQADEYKSDDAAVLSCGLFVKEDEKTITIALDSDKEGFYNGLGSVPKCMIASRKDFVLSLEVRKPEEEKKP